MTDTPIRKFMFERSFDAGAAANAPARDRRPVTYTWEQIEALRKEIYESGFAAGKKAATEELTQHIATTVTKMSADIARLLEQAETARQAQEPRVREAVLAIARKVLPDFSQRNGLQEIQAVVAGIIGEMAKEPRLVVRVNDAQFDAVDASLKKITEQQGYTGKIVLVADADVKADDCRIEWADGGIDRNLEALWRTIGQNLVPHAVTPGAEPAPSPSSATAAEEIKNG